MTSGSGGRLTATASRPVRGARIEIHPGKIGDNGNWVAPRKGRED